jgi:hypothetical protein
MKTKELFLKDPTQWTVANGGVTSNNDAGAETLRYELNTFVCEGEYHQGLARILQGYLDALGKEQKAAWVSGFYGSGKSHMVKVLRYLWTDHRFNDGNSARTLVNLPADVRDLLVELTNRSKQHGGLHAAGGTLKAGLGNVRMRVLGIVLQSVGLPEKLSIARLMMDLRDEGLLQRITEAIASAGKKPADEFERMYTSKVFQQAYLSAYPHLGNEQNVGAALRNQYPTNVAEVSVTDMLAITRRALSRDGKLPCTVLVLDEVQQYINNNGDVALDVQEVIEACQKELDGRVLVVGTGQSALTDTPSLQRIMGRFQIKVHLRDNDVEKVVRTVVLQKKTDKKDAIEKVITTNEGEVTRQLKATRVATRPEDREVYVSDYPLLPVRQRFWEKVLHSIDASGATSQMRTQLRVIHEACRELADKPLGAVVPADFLYDQLAQDLVISGEMQRRYQEIIEGQKAKSDGELRSRICALVFLIGKLPREAGADAGIRANAEHMSDLLTDDLDKSAAKIRQQVPIVLQQLVDEGVLMPVEDGEHRLQTTEGQAWEGEYRKRLASTRNNETIIASHRQQLLGKLLDDVLKSTSVLHGEAREKRKVAVHRGLEAPLASDSINVWVRDGFAESESMVIQDIQRRAVEDATVHILIPKARADDLKNALSSVIAADETINYKGIPTTEPGKEARASMITRKQVEERRVDDILRDILNGARVFLSGGQAITGIGLEASVKIACEQVLDRLYPQFRTADSKNWSGVWTRAKEGNTNALQLVGHTADPHQHPVAVKILSAVGSGKRGTDLVSLFTSPPFGWPKDAVDGTLGVLVQSGHLSARINGQPVKLSELDQRKIGQADFRAEQPVLTAAQKLAVRKLYQDAGITSKAGDELNDASLFINKIRELTTQAGGDAPAPLPPAPTTLKELSTLSGNDLLFEIHARSEDLGKQIAAWKTLREQIASRLPDYYLTEELISYGKTANLPTIDEQEQALKAVLQKRDLLAEPNPVAPIRKLIGVSLRTALTNAVEYYDQVLKRELASMLQNPVWAKLSADERLSLLRTNSIKQRDVPEMGSDVDLASALRKCDLGAWRTHADAIATRCQNALEMAIRTAQPKARKVDLPKATINNEADLDAWLSAARTTLAKALEDGPAII